jgi:hypothetical protein
MLLEKVVGQSSSSITVVRVCGVMRKDGSSRSPLEADCLRCARVKDGSERWRAKPWTRSWTGQGF